MRALRAQLSNEDRMTIDAKTAFFLKAFEIAHGLLFS
jgi:hypothetical protein